jgi:thiol-disulfide isomerase/thioredoxin
MAGIRALAALMRSREVVAGVATVAVVVLGVFLFYSPGESEDAEFYAVSTEADYPPLVVGETAPQFAVATTAGAPFDLADYAGQPIWINVWASWCPPCRAEMPDIEEVRAKAGERGLVFIAMNFQEDDPSVRRYMDAIGYDFTVGLDPEGEFAGRYSVLGLPTHIFIDADGNVDAIRVGGMTRREMDQKADELTAEAVAAR